MTIIMGYLMIIMGIFSIGMFYMCVINTTVVISETSFSSG